MMWWLIVCCVWTDLCYYYGVGICFDVVGFVVCVVHNLLVCDEFVCWDLGCVSVWVVV